MESIKLGDLYLSKSELDSSISSQKETYRGLSKQIEQ